MEHQAGTRNDWKGAAFRRTLVGIVRKRVPERDVEDIVQATLTEALSPSAPADDDEALRRWLIGVARHKIADRHRRGRRESFDVPELLVEAPPHSENDLVRWARGALPEEGEEPRRTFEWMMREGEGEKLESIAESEQIPAPRVRKRVSRLRRHLRAAWKKEVALLAALGIVAVLVWLAHRGRHEPIVRDPIRPVPTQSAPVPLERPALDPAPTPPPPRSVAPSPSSAPVPSSTSTATTPAPKRTGHAGKATSTPGSSQPGTSL